MRDLYKPDADKVEQKVRLKEGMTKEELREAYAGICAAARAYIKQITEHFFKSLETEDRFSITVKTGIINTMPPQYNEAFIKRIGRLSNIAESQMYDVKFSKWKHSKEYNWHFVRQTP